MHAGITAQDVQEKLDSVPGAEFLIHPECSCTSSILYDVAAGGYEGRKVGVYSTEGMMKRAASSDAISSGQITSSAPAIDLSLEVCS